MKLKTGKWHHIAMTVSKEESCLFVNGKLMGAIKPKHTIEFWLGDKKKKGKKRK